MPKTKPMARTTMRPSDIAGVAMITAFMSFFAIGASPGAAATTKTSPSSLAT